MLYFSAFEIKIPSAKSAGNRKMFEMFFGIRSAGAESLNRCVCSPEGCFRPPTLSGEMPTVSPFYEHILLQQAEDYKQAGSSVGRQYGTKH